MAKIAVRSHLESILSSKKRNIDSDTVVIVGKGNRSEDMPVLMPSIIHLLQKEYEIEAQVNKENTGRIRITKGEMHNFIQKKKWKD